MASSFWRFRWVPLGCLLPTVLGAVGLGYIIGDALYGPQQPGPQQFPVPGHPSCYVELTIGTNDGLLREPGEAYEEVRVHLVKLRTAWFGPDRDTLLQKLPTLARPHTHSAGQLSAEWLTPRQLRISLQPASTNPRYSGTATEWTVAVEVPPRW